MSRNKEYKINRSTHTHTHILARFYELKYFGSL